MLNLTEFGLGPGCRHQSLPASGHYRGAPVEHIRAFCKRGIRGKAFLIFPGGDALAGQGRFLYTQFLRLNQPEVRRDYVPGGKQDKVAGDQGGNPHGFHLSGTDQPGTGLSQLAEGLQGAVSPGFHKKSDGDRN